MKNDLKMMRHWLDSELSILHIYVLVAMLLVTEGWLPTTIIGVLIFINAVYAIKRAMWVALRDRKYLHVDLAPKDKDVTV